jgi:outer membrane protein TolC
MNNSGKHPIAKNPVTYAAMLVMALLLFASSTGFAQKNRNDQYIDTAAILKNKALSVEEKLVQLALAGPQFERSDAQNKVTQHQLKKAQNSWFNLLTVTTSYNFGDALNKNDPNSPNGNTYVAPGMNLGLTIPFGVIFSKGTDIKIQRESVRLSQLNQKVLARDLKADVLSKYLQYKTYNKLIIMQSKSVDDEQAAVTQVEKKFREMGTTIEVYNQATKTLNNEVAKLLNLQLAQDQIKLEIEALIGVSLDSVLQGTK